MEYYLTNRMWNTNSKLKNNVSYLIIKVYNSRIIYESGGYIYYLSLVTIHDVYETKQQTFKFHN